MRQTSVGVVVSAFNPKTVKVRTSFTFKHPKVLKTITRQRNYMVHDETSSHGVGDIVRIEACRPMSATKRFKIAELIQKSKITTFLDGQAKEKKDALDVEAR